jgi:hypothetical protein
MSNIQKMSRSKAAKIGIEIRRIKAQIVEAVQAGDIDLAQKLTALLPRREAKPTGLTVPVTIAMKQAAQAAAEAQGLTLSEWLRGLISAATAIEYRRPSNNLAGQRFA